MLDASRDIALRRKLDQPPRLTGASRLAALRSILPQHGWRGIVAPLRAARLGFDEAVLLGLYHQQDIAAAAAFIGKAQQGRFHRACNDIRWFAAADDKAVSSLLLKGAGLPVPETLAFAAVSPRAGLGEWLADADALSRFLARADLPLFAKPVDGMFSLGSFRIDHVTADHADIAGHGSISIADLWAYMRAMSQAGYLLQRCLTPSDFARQNFGAAIASVRLLILTSGSGPQIESAVLKIPTGPHVADNFWRPGNLLAALSPDGRILRVTSGKGQEARELTEHPDTGAVLLGLGVPDWVHLCELAKRAATLLPGIRTQSWDVALTSDGPRLLEVNFGGDLDLHQIAHQRGALTESYAAHLKACGVRLPQRLKLARG